jgi:hypothetical protein
MPLLPDTDPIIQILQLAARRGFEIMRQREQVAGTTPLSANAPDEGRLRDDGANGNSRNSCLQGVDQNADTNSV